MAEEQSKINLWAVFITGFICFILSIFWYSPILFGSIWERYRNPPNPDVPQWTMIFAPLREMLAAYVLANVLSRLQILTYGSAIKLILQLWLAFHAVGMAGAVLWDNMQWQLGVVHAGDWLMKMIVMGLILTWQVRRTAIRQSSI